MAHIVIVGGGVAAGTAAKTLRKEGFDGDVTIVAEEPHPPYQRPPLSKGYLAGRRDLDAVILQSRDGMPSTASSCARRRGRSSLDPAAHEVVLDDGFGSRLRLRPARDGASPRMLAARGCRPAGSRAPCGASTTPTTSRRSCAAAGERLVLIGSGWIGMEVAATARELGNDVTVLERDPVPLAARARHARWARSSVGLHVEHGVDLRTSVEVERITGARARRGRRRRRRDRAGRPRADRGRRGAEHGARRGGRDLRIDNGILTDCVAAHERARRLRGR